MGIYFRDILLTRISRCANNYVHRVFEKKHLFHNDISPHFKFVLSNERLDFCDLKKIYIYRINNADTCSQPSLIIFIKGADIFGHGCIYIYIYIYIYISDNLCLGVH